jgi:hypothetical protein
MYMRKSTEKKGKCGVESKVRRRKEISEKKGQYGEEWKVRRRKDSTENEHMPLVAAASL